MSLSIHEACKLLLELQKEQEGVYQEKDKCVKEGTWTPQHENIFQMTLRTLDASADLIGKKAGL